MKPRKAAKTVWERPEPTKRPTLKTLSREKIVAAAMKLADKRGLEAVSFRNVGAALDAGPMRLYGYVATKKELLELMVDEVYGEMVAARSTRGDWRAALRAMAHRVREASTAHPWFTDLLGGRPHMGPNAFEYRESSMASLSGMKGFEDIDLVLQATSTVIAYVIGAIRSQVSELRSEVESGMAEKEWQNASWPYMTRMMATGRFPTLAKIVKDAKHPPFEVVFERGLDFVLDGIAARLSR